MIYDVAVVGSGFSAISLMANLLEALPNGASIAVVGEEAGLVVGRHTEPNCISIA